MKDLKWFLENEHLAKMPFMKRLAGNLMEKARTNLITMSVLSEVDRNLGARKILNVPNSYHPYEWVVIAGYYSMYVSALSCLAKIGYKSKNHTATILALDEFFVKKGLLEKEILDMLRKTRLEVEFVEMIRSARDKREVAQYSPTKRTSEYIAYEIKADAYRFVERMEKLLADIEE